MKERIIIVDVETCGPFGASKVYDFGFQIVERTTGRVLDQRSYVVPEVFYGKPREMASAYYADKLPMYHEGIESGMWTVAPFRHIRDVVHTMMRKHGIKRVYAYNCAFDRAALNYTTWGISGGVCNDFFPEGTVFCDIWTAACTTIMQQRAYGNFCIEHGHVSEANNFRTTAEVAYAFITGQPEFREDHTGLSDVDIERQILHKCISTKKRMNERIIPNPWKLAQQVHDTIPLF